MRSAMKRSIALTASAVWILLVLIFIHVFGSPKFEFGVFIIFAILPVLTGWATWWIAGTHPHSDKNNDKKHATQGYID